MTSPFVFPFTWQGRSLEVTLDVSPPHVVSEAVQAFLQANQVHLSTDELQSFLAAINAQIQAPPFKLPIHAGTDVLTLSYHAGPPEVLRVVAESFLRGYRTQLDMHAINPKELNADTLVAEMQRRLHYTSQIGQDQWVIEEVFPQLKNGYFVEIGAADGVKLSNTYMLERMHQWQGLLVEASPQVEKCRVNRLCKVEKACLSDKSGDIVDFVVDTKYGEDNHFSGITTHIDCYQVEGHIEKMQTKTFVEVLQAHQSPKYIHYLSIDTEGSEYTILKDFPFNEYSFGCITVEHNYVEPKRTQILQLLNANGYKLEKSVMQDDWYVQA